MRKYILTIICLLAMSASGCGNGDKKTGVAIALADTTAGLIAWSEAVQVLIDLEEITADKAKGQFQVNDKIRTGVKQIREKLEQVSGLHRAPAQAVSKNGQGFWRSGRILPLLLSGTIDWTRSELS